MILGIYKWKKVSGMYTPGGDPCYVCPNCGGDEHVYGIENLNSYHHICKECQTELIYPWENEESYKWCKNCPDIGKNERRLIMGEIVNVPAKASRGKRAVLQMIDDIYDEQYKEFFDKIDENIGIVDIREVVNGEIKNDD